MHQKRSIAAVFGVTCLAVSAWLLTAAIGAAGQAKPSGTAKVAVVTVTAGKPSELAFKLSKFSNLPAGTITFKVTNQGFGFHDFKLCLAPTSTASAKTCAGKKTKLLKHGESDTLTVTLTKAGKYQYLCSVPGHAAAGMKGLIGVGVTVAATSPAASTNAGGSSSSGSSSSGSSSSGSTTGGTTTTTPAAGGGGGAGGGAATGECPAGMTVAQGAATFGEDHDEDDGGGPTDFDGCL